MLHVVVGHSKFESGRSEKLLAVSYQLSALSSQLLAFGFEPRALSFERSTGALPRERFTSLELTLRS